MEKNYQSGFGNHHSSEALTNALPQGQNSPQKAPYGLYTEQLSGAAFTSPRHSNLHSWLYRIHPSVLHGEFKALKTKTSQPIKHMPPTQMRWGPLPYPKKSTDFICGLVKLANNGDLKNHRGAAIYLYACNQSMSTYFYNADGEFLIVPQEGQLYIKTEFGPIDLKPSEIAVIPRGIKFQVELAGKQARGYICENFAAPLRLPELGPIGANGLANPRDFQYPRACYEQKQGDFYLSCKFLDQLWQAPIKHSPLDVVAWHGNYAPYKYDLTRFNTINTVSFDHPDPSIFTVLTSSSNTPGVANLDFVVFPERWMVAEHSFRPPYFHRNIMSEFMGLVHGVYDAKTSDFAPGGSSLHNCMSAHGPDAVTYQKASTATLKPQKCGEILAFMFESCYVWHITEDALNAKFRQHDYLNCWQDLKTNFNPV
ncbi:MAG: homogentisate 1,2-dioxygenase [Gammaproteobacteria bacterium]